MILTDQKIVSINKTLIFKLEMPVILHENKIIAPSEISKVGVFVVYFVSKMIDKID